MGCVCAAYTAQTQPSRKKSKKQKKKHKQQQAQMAAAGLGGSSDSEPEAASCEENTADSRGGATDGRPQADLDSEDDVLERMMQAAHIHQGAASHEVIITAPLPMCQYANVLCTPCSHICICTGQLHQTASQL